MVPSMRAVIKSNLALAKSYFGFIDRMAKIYDVKEDAGLAFRLKDDTVCYISADELGDEYTERMLRLYYLDNSLYTEIEFAIKKLLKYRHQKEKYEVCYNRYDSVENINLQINLSNIMYKYNISCYKDLTDQIVDTKLLMQELKRNKLFEKNQYTEKSEALTYLKEYTKYMDIYNKYERLNGTRQYLYGLEHWKEIECCKKALSAKNLYSVIENREPTAENFEKDAERHKKKLVQIEHEIAENELKALELEQLRLGLNKALMLEQPKTKEVEEKLRQSMSVKNQ